MVVFVNTGCNMSQTFRAPVPDCLANVKSDVQEVLADRQHFRQESGAISDLRYAVTCGMKDLRSVNSSRKLMEAKKKLRQELERKLHLAIDLLERQRLGLCVHVSSRNTPCNSIARKFHQLLLPGIPQPGYCTKHDHMLEDDDTLQQYLTRVTAILRSSPTAQPAAGPVVQVPVPPQGPVHETEESELEPYEEDTDDAMDVSAPNQ